jgi:hypothetical protein
MVVGEIAIYLYGAKQKSHVLNKMATAIHQHSMNQSSQGVHPEFANTSWCHSVSHSRANGNPQILGFYIDSHLRGNDTDICKSGMLPSQAMRVAYGATQSGYGHM